MSTGASDHIKVDYDALSRARTALTTAATSVADTGTSSPTSVDAGDMTGPISALLAAINDSAAALSEGMHAAGQKVGDNAVTYSRSDQSAASQFRIPPGAVR